MIGEPTDRSQRLQEVSGFSEEERRFIAWKATQPGPSSTWGRFFGYAAFFLPAVLIGIYGLVVQSFQAVAIAFLILVTNVAWSLAGVFREQRQILLLQAILVRLQAMLENERNR